MRSGVQTFKVRDVVAGEAAQAGRLDGQAWIAPTGGGEHPPISFSDEHGSVGIKRLGDGNCIAWQDVEGSRIGS